MNINKLFKRILTLSLILSMLITSFPLSVLAETFEAEVTASRMAVREGKTSSTELLGYLEKGTIVTVLDYADGIAYIEFKGKKGYARVSDMKRVSSAEEKAPEKEDEPDHGLATVIEREISIYEKATSGSKEVGTLKKGVTVLVLEVDERGWAKLEMGDEICYTRSIYLEIDEDAKATPSPVKNAASGKATVTASSLPIYASASTDSRLMTTLKKGQTFTVLATGNGWAKLQNGSNIGYARLIGLSLSNETPEPTPMPTEKPGSSASGIATVKVHSAYVYQEASSGSKKIDIIYRDESFTLLSISGEWAKLQNGNSIGYVKVSNLSISEGESATPAPTKTVTPTATPKAEKSLSGLGTVNVHSLYVYESASSGADKLGYIFRGETYTVLATSGEWAKIEDGDRIVYVKLSGLTIDEGAKATPKPENIIGSVTVTVHSKHIYDKASTGATKKGYIFRNNTYPLLEVSGSWVKIKVGDEAVYTTVDDLTINDQTAPTQKPTQKPEESLSGIAEVQVNSVYVYASPSDDSRRMCQIYKGEKYTLLSTSNGWAKLQNGSSIGYVELESLSIKEDAEATPAPTSTPIPVPDVIEGPVAEVNVTKMYVYAGKSVSAESLGSLSKGSTVTILESDGTWAKIYKDNKVGFCKYASLKLTGEYEGITPEPTAAATPAPTAPIQAIMEVDSFVNTSSAKIYADVSTSSTVLKTVSAGYEVTVLGLSGDWAYVEYGDNRGYMLKETLIAKKDATLTANMESPAVISASSLTVYKFASEYAPSYGKFAKGTEVTVLAYKDGWAMLKRGNAIGYADADGISIISNEQNPTLP
ncbi:MAG: SH3 domain-containing protein, partial [Clostridia bacterium]|nr:SH3 domain-containing protein [Clostridia bacterium]